MARERDNRTDIEKADHRREIAALYVRGATQAQIAAQIGISQATVSRDLKVIHGEWRKEMLGDFDERKARELAKIDALEAEYWDAWKASRLPREVSTAGQDVDGAVLDATGKPAGGKLKTKTQKRREGRDGNPQFLAGLQWCIEQRCKLFGFYPAKVLTVQQLDQIIDQLTPTQHVGNADSTLIN